MNLLFEWELSLESSERSLLFSKDYCSLFFSLVYLIEGSLSAVEPPTGGLAFGCIAAFGFMLWWLVRESSVFPAHTALDDMYWPAG